MRIADLILLGGFILAAGPAARAQVTEPRQVVATERERLVAPVALYPDVMLSIVLVASTFPDEIREAASWSSAHGAPRGEAAVRLAMSQSWDAAVRALAAFPELLQRLSEAMPWARALGDAYLSGEDDMLGAVQGLRRRALTRAEMKAFTELRIEHRDGFMVIDLPASGSVSLPWYEPARVLGAGDGEWPPSPLLGSAPSDRRGGIFVWGPATTWSRGFVYAGFDWRAGRAHVPSIRNDRPITTAVAATRTTVALVTRSEPMLLSKQPLAGLLASMRPLPPAKPTDRDPAANPAGMRATTPVANPLTVLGRPDAGRLFEPPEEREHNRLPESPQETRQGSGAGKVPAAAAATAGASAPARADPVASVAVAEASAPPLPAAARIRRRVFASDMDRRTLDLLEDRPGERARR